MNELTIVTGASSNHFTCLLNLLFSLATFEKGTRVIVYDLGLESGERERLRKHPVETRRFRYEDYPGHFDIRVASGQFAWKPAIISEVFEEVGGDVLWLDAGDLVHRRLDRVREVLQQEGIYSPVSHADIRRWTHPGTLQYLNVASHLLPQRNRNAAIVGLSPRREGIAELVARWKACALDLNCIAPPGSDRSNHRQDQAVFTVLAYQFQERHHFRLIDQNLDVSAHNDRLSFEAARDLLLASPERARVQEAGRPGAAPRNEDAATGGTRLYCVGAARTGTHSIVSLFEAHVRAEHEAGADQLIRKILDRTDGKVTDRELGDWLRARERELNLAVDSSQLNYWIVDLLVREFRSARFLLTVRDCYSWLDSLLNHSLNRPAAPDWVRLRDLRFRPGRFRHEAGEGVLKENGLYALEGYLTYWSQHNQRVLDVVPAERLLVVRTDQIPQRAAEIAAFARLPAVSGERLGTCEGGKRHCLLARIDRDYLEGKVKACCGALMKRFFPEITSLDGILKAPDLGPEGSPQSGAPEPAVRSG